MARKQITVSCEDSVWERFKSCCESLDMVPSRVLDRLMKQWLSSHEKEANDRIKE